MTATAFLRTWAPGLAATAFLLSTCGFSQPGAVPGANPRSPESPDLVRERLQGTWLRESVAQGVVARRVLVLRPDGTFDEKVRLVDDAGAASEHVHAGTWTYDGTNLKRKYTVMDGRPPSRLNLPFATFQVRFDGRDGFEGTDHIRGHRVRYDRVAGETSP